LPSTVSPSDHGNAERHRRTFAAKLFENNILRVNLRGSRFCGDRSLLESANVSVLKILGRWSEINCFGGQAKSRTFNIFGAKSCAASIYREFAAKPMIPTERGGGRNSDTLRDEKQSRDLTGETAVESGSNIAH
jgi:hypothetical protein